MLSCCGPGPQYNKCCVRPMGYQQGRWAAKGAKDRTTFLCVLSLVFLEFFRAKEAKDDGLRPLVSKSQGILPKGRRTGRPYKGAGLPLVARRHLSCLPQPQHLDLGALSERKNVEVAPLRKLQGTIR